MDAADKTAPALTFNQRPAALTAVDGWEAVVPPPPPPLPSAEDHGREWEMVTTSGAGDSASDDCSIFPPSLHEGLHLRHPDLDPVPPLSHLVPERVVSDEPPSSPTRRHVVEEEELRGMPPVVAPPMMSFSESARRFIGSGIEVLHSKISLWSEERGRGGVAYLVGGRIWPLAAVAGFMGALMYLRRKHRRDKELLLLLIQEKDQRISELLSQIALMKEIIAARHQVSVLRRL